MITQRRAFQNAAGVMLLVGAFVLVSSPAHAMNKAELVDAIASSSGLSKADSKRALESFVDATSGALKKGDKVSLVGFGSFSISRRAARTGRNPQTGKEIQIATRNVVKFKAGADLAGKVNFTAEEGSVQGVTVPECDLDVSTGEIDFDDVVAAMAADGVATPDVILLLILDLLTVALNSGETVHLVGFADLLVRSDLSIDFVPGAALAVRRSGELEQRVTAHVVLSAIAYQCIVATATSEGGVGNQLNLPDLPDLTKAVEKYVKLLEKQLALIDKGKARADKIVKGRAKLVKKMSTALKEHNGDAISPVDTFTAFEEAGAAVGTVPLPLSDEVTLYLIGMMAMQGDMVDEWTAAFTNTTAFDPDGDPCPDPGP